MAVQSPMEAPAASFASLLRRLRTEARLTQEELAEKAGLSPRSISDLERGISRTARKETANLLADALSLGESVRMAFVAAARGRAPISDVLDELERTPPNGASLSPPETELLEKLMEALTALRLLLTALSRVSGRSG